MQARSFSPSSEITGSSIEAKCEPKKKYKRAHEKRTSKPVKSPFGVGRYYDMFANYVSQTRSHLLWIYSFFMFDVILIDLDRLLMLKSAEISRNTYVSST